MSCILDTHSINLTVASGELSADLIVDPATGKAPNPLSVGVPGVYVAGADGWLPLPVALAYSSTDGNTFVATASADLTSFIGAGDKIRLVQGASTLYFFVTAITAGTITLYGGQNYALANAAITLPFFSKAKSPIGFPLSAVGWTEQMSDGSDRTQGSPTPSVWYNPGSLSLAVPIGVWHLEWWAAVSNSQAATLSTANNAESDTDFTYYANIAASPVVLGGGRRKDVALAAKTSYYLDILTQLSPTSIGLDGSSGRPSIIRAVCAYL